MMKRCSYTRREFLRTVSAGTAAVALGGLAQGRSVSRRPNVLFLMTDQQTLRAMSAYGNPYLRKPHMDSLAVT
ncbi:MAG: twin-arginine translocation signal domain-containing protein, partial [Planctomycetota bacterium]